jgi:Fe-Mn family superoxide dismutase
MPFELPSFPYDYDALEPHIDEETMRLHHGSHHTAYTNKLNAAISGTEWDILRIEELLRKSEFMPETLKLAVRQFGGGFANHSLFWLCMGPDEGGSPDGVLCEAICDAFGSFDDFKSLFQKIALAHFGSGWAWLVVDQNGMLKSYTTSNQDSPLVYGDTPILCLDVWEHAYYKQYGPKRLVYIENWWNLVNWRNVQRFYSQALRK